ncbi:MAG: cyclase family protein [Anaerolineae bacterium]|nr:cyclase family protein [Anaerolineae bacterium]
MTTYYRLLSYPLSATAPVWPGNPPAAAVEPLGSIAAGGSSNTTLLHLFSHSGTHVDAPKHFNDAGPAAVELPITAFIFSRPYVVEVPKTDDQFIGREDLEPHRAALATADLCLLRTGWSALRDAEPERYARHGPLLHPDAARFLVDECPGLRGVATDAISIGAPGFRRESVLTHQILTGVGRRDGRFLLIFEDLRIDPDLGRAQRIYAWPLLIVGSDGSPCTIVAEFAG